MPGKTICLNLSDDGKTITLGGDVDQLRRDRRMMISLKRISPGFDATTMTVDVGDREIHELLLDLHDALSKRGYLDEGDGGANDALNRYYAEERDFAEFSEKARRIRNNDCEAEDFHAFEVSVADNLPGRSLYPLQLLSAYHLAFSQNACNFSVPGAGKTTIVYAAYAYLKNISEESTKHVDSLVVVGPLSSFQPWEDEYESCFNSHPVAKRLDGSLSLWEKRSYLIGGKPADITLISYASLDSIKDCLLDFMSRNRTMLVLDEAHKVKNTAGGTWAAAALFVSRAAKARVILTGTPAPNGYEDLYNLFEFIWPGRNVSKFQVNQLAEMSKNELDSRIPRLLEYLEPYYIRIRKSDLHLPPVSNKALDLVQLGPIQQRIYDGLERLYLEPILDTDLDDERGRNNALARIVRLMQATGDPAVLLDISEDPETDLELTDDLKDDIRLFAEDEAPAKFRRCLEIAREIVSAGEKVIIWTHFVSTLMSLRNYLESNGLHPELLYGGTPSGGFDDCSDELQSTREAIIREFNDPESRLNVVIANPAAVAESISLHHACHNAIYLERGFNAAQYLQSRDRIHRYGLDGNVTTTYYKIAAAGTIDEVVDQRLMAKEERMMRIVESAEIPLFDNVEEGIGSDDIKALIRDYVGRTNRL